MKVKCLVAFVGVNASMRKNEERELDKKVAQELIKGGLVEEVKKPKKIDDLSKQIDRYIGLGDR
jgi:hypothetical protein